MNMTAAQYRAPINKQSRNKYGNQKTVFNGHTYDSKAEANYAAELMLRFKVGEVSNIEEQKPFPLIVGAGRLIGTYKADFVFYDNVLKRDRIIDVKGVETPLFKLKKKFVEALYGVEVECVKVRS